MKKIAVLGSTGSIGTQALEVIHEHSDKLQATVLVAHRNTDLLRQQIEEFHPELVAVTDREAGKQLRATYTGPTKIIVGPVALTEAAAAANVEIVLVAISGAIGIAPTLAAIDAHKVIALANKETMVAAGDLVNRKAVEADVTIYPVDSEHSAIFQCLQAVPKDTLANVILTASGGPFRGYSAAQLANVTVADCLKHPTWQMGQKITIDSASLFNKGLEVIEAHHLFAVDYDKIEVVVHPQSIVHSMIRLRDGGVLAQLGVPDMKLPIQLAFSYPERWTINNSPLDWDTERTLEFESPATDVFRSLPLAYQAGRMGQSATLVYNAANEEAVKAFIAGKISFTDLFTVTEEMVITHTPTPLRDWQDIVAADRAIRKRATEFIATLSK
ncbi:1-deoxy-D-xylulose-5-phosphate reductoisomerase [Negativicoccus succinicivorans]|uniref:1-deoxy-D-xylulose-5-phosphate reductoisomerase n=1 Tax=Negativicoccus succinicivorans TaxID=620903 RepID=UPI002903545A|nr:1-deoxy-D-xylulose-5-phosphate reductoisomerase [Negativicoccus succinicivorans]MDU2417354.1 1-deoxy-D-xylulose-5-phosphate reductoisomerase [Negativicoccus succinicivorans]